MTRPDPSRRDTRSRGENGAELAPAEDQAPSSTQPSNLARGYMPSAKTVEWCTPQEVVELLHVLWDGPPDVDPCSHPNSIVDARVRVMLPEYAVPELERDPAVTYGDGLAMPWAGRVFVNPPFAELETWVAKADGDHERYGAYWQSFIRNAAAIRFWRGRMRFLGAKDACPFPVALAYWGPRPWDFHRVFRHRGMVIAP